MAIEQPGRRSRIAFHRPLDGRGARCHRSRCNGAWYHARGTALPHGTHITYSWLNRPHGAVLLMLIDARSVRLCISQSISLLLVLRASLKERAANTRSSPCLVPVSRLAMYCRLATRLRPGKNLSGAAVPRQVLGGRSTSLDPDVLARHHDHHYYPHRT